MTKSKKEHFESQKTNVHNNISVLIIGDWFIDEHWTMGIHRSATSSRTGKGHYRALQGIDSKVRAFCGAGRTAFFLHQVRTKNENPLFKNLTGLGFWHHDDTNHLYTLFDPTSQVHSPYRLRDKSISPTTPHGLKLINMNDVLLQSVKEKEEKAFTNRIIRIYSTKKDGKVTYNRYDWEQYVKKVEWNEIQLNEIIQKLEGYEPSVIIVKDLLKNAVNLNLIKKLANKYKDARWYISSKKWRPDWLKVLNSLSVSIELLLVPQVAAQEALKLEKITSWLSNSQHPSKEALKTIQELYDDTNAKSIIVLPEGLSAIARIPDHKNKNKALCVIQPEIELKPIKVPMGGQSILFPALCSGIEYAYATRSNKQSQINIKKILEHAFECTSDWISAEGDRVLCPSTWEPDPKNWHPKPSLLDVSHIDDDPQFRLDKFNNWDVEIDAWANAEKQELLGVITKAGNKELQLRRSMTEVSGYVCWGSEKRENLRTLVQGINEFHLNPKYPTAAMLIAAPGSGKSFLIKQLAKSACLEPLAFNITHISSRGEIINWFDTILTKQQERPDKKFLVFIDEINSDLDGSKPYSAFLSPLEDGFYVRNGQTYPLQPAVWIFAGTNNPREKNEKEGEQKGSDFMSRMTLGGINGINLNPHIGNPHKALERIYLGAAMLKSTFPDVQHVSEDVLRVFNDLGIDTDIRVRDIKHFVRQFSNIQYARVTSINVPSEWPKDEKNEKYNNWKKNISNNEEANIAIIW